MIVGRKGEQRAHISLERKDGRVDHCDAGAGFHPSADESGVDAVLEVIGVGEVIKPILYVGLGERWDCKECHHSESYQVFHVTTGNWVRLRTRTLSVYAFVTLGHALAMPWGTASARHGCREAKTSPGNRVAERNVPPKTRCPPPASWLKCADAKDFTILVV